MNSRQFNFIEEMKRMADIKAAVYGYDKLYQQMWDEEFKTGKDNDLNTLTSAEWAELGFEYDDVNDFVTRNIDHSITYWEGGSTLADVERGRYARRIKAGNRNLI